MKKYSNETPLMTIGLDLGDTDSYLTLLDEEGEVIKQGRIATRETTLQKRFSGLA
jgi:predicted NBD/HSP70 family sugar kinase